MAETGTETTETQTENSTRVFVYGTLKRGYGNHYALKEAEFLGECAIDGGFTMLDLGWYPGVVQGGTTVGDGKVHGEVYRVDEPTLHVLDLIEGHPAFYERKKVVTPWKNAWVYLLPTDYLKEDNEVIEGGEWNGGQS